MIKIGIAGSGSSIKNHVRQLLETRLFEIIGFCCTDLVDARNIIKEFNLPHFTTLNELIKRCDVIDFASVTKNYFDSIALALKNSKHVYIAFPYHLNTTELKAINSLLKEAEVVGQTGHTERFNPAFLAAAPLLNNPTFIDTARLIQYSPQNSKVSVIHDLMIKDIDIVLALIRSNVKKISANAVSIMHENPDMVSARIEFDNGSIANLTAGRVSEMNIRKTRVYQNQSYVFIDFYEKWVKCSSKISEHLDFEDIPVTSVNEGVYQFTSFANSIKTGSETFSSVETAHSSIEIALRIADKIKLHTNIFSE